MSLTTDTKIKVNTRFGLSQPTNVGAVIGQGTIGGALVSQAVLDEAVMEHFIPGSDLHLNYGSVPLAPFMYQDDLVNGTEDISKARIANDKVDHLMKQRGLSLNEDKSVVMVIGSKKQKEKIANELKDNPLMCGTFETKEKQTEKYLGQILSSAGLADSVAVTIEARLGKIKGACHEIAHIINDWRAQAIGGIDTAIFLWETCCISSLMNGSGTWVDISAKTEKTLNSIQQWFIRLILQVHGLPQIVQSSPALHRVRPHIHDQSHVPGLAVPCQGAEVTT